MAEFRIYKPRKDKDGKFVGAATSFQVTDKEYESNGKKYLSKGMVFITSTNQKGEDANGNASFDWKSDKNPNGKEVRMKLGDPDIGELLAVLNGVKNKVGQPSGKGLYHQTDEKSNSALSFERKQAQDPSKYDDGYLFTISSKKDNNLVRVSHTINLAEAEILRILLSEAIKRKYT